MSVLAPPTTSETTIDDAVGAPRHHHRQAGQWVVVLAPVTLLLMMAWQLRWMSDDGFIHLRVVEQLISGNGPVFNPGERVEASTSPLWVALLGLLYPVTSLALPWKAVLLGIALCAAGLLAAQHAAVWFAGRGAGVVVPLGAIVVACLPPFWEFASSGLETGLAFAWLGGSCWWCARRTSDEAPTERRADLLGAMFVGLGPLIRPDLVLFSVAFGAVLLAALWPDGRRDRLRFMAALVVVPTAYQIFRMGYYAMVVPNTAVAKEAGESNWGQGRQYLADLVLPYWLWLPAGLLAVVLAVQVVEDMRTGRYLRGAARAAPALAAAGHALYLTRVGGDFMHARLLLPAVFAAAAPVGLRVTPADLRIGIGRGAWRVGLVPIVCGWAVICAVALRPHLSSPAPWGGAMPISGDGTIAEEREFYRTIRHMDVPVRLDLSIAEQLAKDPRSWPQKGLAYVGESNEPELERLPLRPDLDVASAQSAMSVGASSVAWGNDVHVIDVLSLAHPVGSHLDQRVGERPGHQKPVPLPWRAAGLSDAVEVVTTDGRIAVAADELRAAEHALECGQLGSYLSGIHEPLTPARFIGNVVDSVANTMLRVPLDPFEAETELC